MSRCVMLACIFISSWIPCTDNIVIVQCPLNCVLVLQVRVFAWRSSINRTSHALGGVFSLSLSHFFFFHLMYIACIVLILLVLPWFAFPFPFLLTHQMLAIFDKKRRICSIFVCSMYKQPVKHLIFSYTLTWSHDNLTRQFVKCWSDFCSWICPSQRVMKAKICGGYKPGQKPQVFLQQLDLLASPLFFFPYVVELKGTLKKGEALSNLFIESKFGVCRWGLVEVCTFLPVKSVPFSLHHSLCQFDDSTCDGKLLGQSLTASFQAHLPDTNETNVGFTHAIAGHKNIKGCCSTWQMQHGVVLVYEAATNGVECFLLSSQKI